MNSNHEQSSRNHTKHDSKHDCIFSGNNHRCKTGEAINTPHVGNNDDKSPRNGRARGRKDVPGKIVFMENKRREREGEGDGKAQHFGL